jgi:hypothetical protein
MPETEQQRTAKDIRDAEERGRRKQVVDGRLDDHDRRLSAINGSIERSARAQEGLKDEVAGVKRAVADVLAKMETQEAVAAALGKAAVSRREFWMGVAAVCAVLAAAFLQGGHL